jgi:hypothetical protein
MQHSWSKLNLYSFYLALGYSAWCCRKHVFVGLIDPSIMAACIGMLYPWDWKPQLWCSYTRQSGRLEELGGGGSILDDTLDDRNTTASVACLRTLHLSDRNTTATAACVRAWGIGSGKLRHYAVGWFLLILSSILQASIDLGMLLSDLGMTPGCGGHDVKKEKGNGVRG